MQHVQATGAQRAALLEEVRKKLAEKFGITLIGENFTLRTNLNGVHVEVSAMVTSITQYVPACDYCRNPFTPTQRQYTAWERVQLFDSDPGAAKVVRDTERFSMTQTRKVVLCHDCYAPQ